MSHQFKLCSGAVAVKKFKRASRPSNGNSTGLRHKKIGISRIRMV